MSEEKIEVIAYSGYRGEERPKAFILREQRIEVVRVQERWVEERLDEKARRRFFKVEGSDGVLHKIFYSEKSLEWYYQSQEE